MNKLKSIIYTWCLEAERKFNKIDVHLMSSTAEHVRYGNVNLVSRTTEHVKYGYVYLVFRTPERVKYRNIHLVSRPLKKLNTAMYIWCIKLILKSLMFILMNYMNYMK